MSQNHVSYVSMDSAPDINYIKLPQHTLIKGRVDNVTVSLTSVVRGNHNEHDSVTFHRGSINPLNCVSLAAIITTQILFIRLMLSVHHVVLATEC